MVTARVDGRLVGFVLLGDYDDGYVDLNDLAVHPDFQRRGIGQAVCDDSVDWMRDLGFARIFGMAISAGSEDLRSSRVRSGIARRGADPVSAELAERCAA